MKYNENIPLPNGCLFVIGLVEFIVLPNNTINHLGQLDLEQLNSVWISGLNTYYGLNKLANFPYVRTSEIPVSFNISENL